MSESDFETVQAGYVEEGAGNPVFLSILRKLKRWNSYPCGDYDRNGGKETAEGKTAGRDFFGADTPYLQVAKAEWRKV